MTSTPSPTPGTHSGPLAGYRETDPSGARPLAVHTLEGASVHAADGPDIGHLSDLLVDLGGGRITHALIATADGRDDRLIAVPWALMSADTEGKGLRVDAQADRVFAAPGFDRDRSPSARDPDWARAIARHFGSRA
ncbi:PRC-barrel domain-containing protein [Burkholderia sp. Ac-20379]|uniref:PRC-barrel domain-containing protein n=1 Tax=Burkholderia sp. Ac-20379 TaxID=2703900 RepID=UPI00197F4070|nr:PRC-barrel domain-containing protein [Burkholderia sp. Ac-20379]MBN3727807.1 PRC-barrel domain containing protein [Burkholderia sp. Ac-20379]